MTHERALWPSGMISFGPHWHKENRLVLLIATSSTGDWWLKHINVLHIVKLSCMA